MATYSSRKLKSGESRHTAQIRINHDGKTVYSESKSFAKKRDAQAWARDREAEIAARGLPGTESDLTVAAGFEGWLADLERTRKGPGRTRGMAKTHGKRASIPNPETGKSTFQSLAGLH